MNELVGPSAVSDVEASVMRMTEAQRIVRFIALTGKKRELGSLLDEVQEHLHSLEAHVIRDFQAANVQKITAHGHTIHLIRNLSVKSKGGDVAAIIEKLRRARLGELLGVNWQRLPAWCRERMQNATTGTWELMPNKLPPTLAEVVELSEYHKLGCRKA